MDPKPTDNNKRAPESAPSDSANETPSKKSKVDSRTTGKGGRSSKGDRRAGNRGDTDSRRNWGSNANKTRGGQMKSWGVNADGTSTVPETEEKKDRLPKKKVAVLIGYNGIGYSGSQMNPGVETVEGMVFKAMVAAGAISEDNSDAPHKTGLARAARTDAGVHAAVNIIALKLILNPNSKPAEMSLEDHINTFLPITIRVWSILRVQGAFNPRSSCDQRQYEYTLPTHVFLGPKPGTPMDTWMQKTRATTINARSAIPITAIIPPPPIESTEATTLTISLETSTTALPSTPALTETELANDAAFALSDAFWATQSAESTSEEDLVARRTWRISSPVVESIRTFVKAYEGSHNYCGFTVGKEYRDRSNQRVMKKLTVSDPFVVAGVEYVSVGFLGQSFMLHQIRKMIGLTILAIRSCTPASLIAETFGPSRIHIPKAPGLGLLLDEPQFFEYNKRVVESNDKLDLLLEASRIEDKEFNEQKRDAVEVPTGRVRELVDEFKKVEIYKRMWEVEQEEGVFSKWLNFLDSHQGSDFEYLNSKGIIPLASVFKKGENNEKHRALDGIVVDASPLSDDEGATGGDDAGS